MAQVDPRVTLVAVSMARGKDRDTKTTVFLTGQVPIPPSSEPDPEGGIWLCSKTELVVFSQGTLEMIFQATKRAGVILVFIPRLLHKSLGTRLRKSLGTRLGWVGRSKYKSYYFLLSPLHAEIASQLRNSTVAALLRPG